MFAINLTTNSTSSLKLINSNNVMVGVYSGYLKIQPDHITNKVDHMDDAVYIFRHNYLKEQQSPARISSLIFTQSKIVLPNSAISQYRNKLMNWLMIEKLGILMVLLLIVWLQSFQSKMILVLYMLLMTCNLDS